MTLTPDEVRARFAWARRRGHPAWLWPEVTVEGWLAALRSIEGVTARTLAGALAGELRGDPAAIGIAAYTSGMGPLLGFWFERGVLDAAAGVGEVLRSHLRHNRRRMLGLAEAGAGVVERLAAAGVPTMVTKGMHTANEYFPDPATRPLSDIDLFVPSTAVAAAEAVFRHAGYRPLLVQRNPYKCDWAPIGAERLPRSLSLNHEDDPFTFDVHASLDRNFFGVGTAHLDALVRWDTAPRWSPAPAAAAVPAQPALLLLLATHASEGFHGLSLIRLVELAWVVRRDVERGALRWGEVADAAEAIGALRFAYPALEMCERLAPGAVPVAELQRFRSRATPAMRRVLARLTPATAQRLDRLSLEERFMWAGTPGERARRLAYAIWPAPAGRSVAELGRIYGRRAWRLIQGRVGR